VCGGVLILITAVIAGILKSGEKNKASSTSYDGPRNICPHCGADNRGNRIDCWSCDKKLETTVMKEMVKK
jgi:hypothetical protein